MASAIARPERWSNSVDSEYLLKFIEMVTISTKRIAKRGIRDQSLPCLTTQLAFGTRHRVALSRIKLYRLPHGAGKAFENALADVVIV